jgi:hypothetical protein
MRSQDNAFVRHQQTRWLRPDAHRWVRPDAARFLKPGADVAAAYPALARKYNQNQPRVPKGNGDESGQWTDGDESGSGRPRVYITRTISRDEETDEAGSGQGDFGPSLPTSSIDIGDIAKEIEKEIRKLDLFGIKPRKRDSGGIRLAGDPPQGLGGPQAKPPEIPKQRPAKSWQRTAVLRSVLKWAVGKAPAVDVFLATVDGIKWLREYEDVIRAARDPAKTLEELQSDLSPKPGYDKHHIVEKTAAQRWGFSKDDTDSPENLVMIPRLKHYQITGWYASRTDEFNGLSPREYLQDKDWHERRKVGLYALTKFGVLKP